MNSNVQYFNTIPVKKFNWKKFLLIIASLIALYFIIFQPYLVGELIGTWLKLIVDGFNHKYL